MEEASLCYVELRPIFRIVLCRSRVGKCENFYQKPNRIWHSSLWNVWNRSSPILSTIPPLEKFLPFLFYLERKTYSYDPALHRQFLIVDMNTGTKFDPFWNRAVLHFILSIHAKNEMFNDWKFFLILFTNFEDISAVHVSHIPIW